MTEKNKALIVIAAGGTGGHVIPAGALAESILAKGYDVLFVTDKRGETIARDVTDAELVVTEAESHMAGGLFGKIKGFWSLFRAALMVRGRFKQHRPELVVGFGGYPSLPGVIAAWMNDIPFIVHEQNAVLGRVNRLVAKNAKVIALGMEPTRRLPENVPTHYTGNPVRQVIAQLRNIAYSVPFGAGDIRFLVLGGSQGARILSDIVPAAITQLDREFRDRLVVSHQARSEDVDRVTQAYKDAGVRAEVKPYFKDVASHLIKSHLLIARAGASTLAETTVLGRPAILVPLKIAMDDHQSANAAILEEAGGAFVLREDDFTAEKLQSLIVDLLDEDLEKLRDASGRVRDCAIPDATDRLLQVVMGAIGTSPAGENAPEGEAA